MFNDEDDKTNTVKTILAQFKDTACQSSALWTNSTFSCFSQGSPQRMNCLHLTQSSASSYPTPTNLISSFTCFWELTPRTYNVFTSCNPPVLSHSLYSHTNCILLKWTYIPFLPRAYLTALTADHNVICRQQSMEIPVSPHLSACHYKKTLQADPWCSSTSTLNSVIPTAHFSCISYARKVCFPYFFCHCSPPQHQHHRSSLVIQLCALSFSEILNPYCSRGTKPYSTFSIISLYAHGLYASVAHLLHSSAIFSPRSYWTTFSKVLHPRLLDTSIFSQEIRRNYLILHPLDWPPTSHSLNEPTSCSIMISSFIFHLL